MQQSDRSVSLEIYQIHCLNCQLLFSRLFLLYTFLNVRSVVCLRALAHTSHLIYPNHPETILSCKVNSSIDGCCSSTHISALAIFLNYRVRAFWYFVRPHRLRCPAVRYRNKVPALRPSLWINATNPESGNGTVIRKERDMSAEVAGELSDVYAGVCVFSKSFFTFSFEALT